MVRRSQTAMAVRMELMGVRMAPRVRMMMFRALVVMPNVQITRLRYPWTPQYLQHPL